MKFLSPEWLAEVGALATGASPGGALRVHQRVTGGPDGDVEYTMRVADGTVTYTPGPGPADVELTLDYATAAAISQGRLSPAAAFAAGRLRAGGSVAALAAHQEAVARIGERLASVPAATEY